MEKIAVSAAKFLVRQGGGDVANLDIYEYGIVVALSFLVNAAVAVLVGIVFSALVDLLVFFLPFAVHRSLSGGYHADTWWGCLLMSSIVIAITLLLIKSQASAYTLQISIALLLFSCVSTFIFAPIENPNNPLTAKGKVKFRKCSRLCTLLFVTLGAMLFVAGMESHSFSVALALGISGATQMICVIQKRRRCSK